jgi:hypothetical protein
MSTWSQHALSNTATNRLEVNSNVNDHFKSVEILDRLGEINHTSVLSGDFGTCFFFHFYMI